MKWYVLPSLLACGLNCMLAAIVLSLTSFHLLTDKITNAPIAPIEEWISLVSGVALFSAAWMIVSLAGLWVTMMRKQIWLSSVVLACDTIGFGISLYFTVAFCCRLGMEDVKADALFNTTFNEISLANSQHQSRTWIPEWLDNIQKQSKSCCGILTYRDYEDYWPASPTKIPRSCCRDFKNRSAPCPDDLTKIPFPFTPADYIKVETGCMDEINQVARRHMQESYNISILMTVFVGVATVSFLLVYMKRYFYPSSETELGSKWPTCDGKDKGQGDAADVDALNANENKGQAVGIQALNVASSNQISSPIDSIEGVSPMVSVEAPSLPTSLPVSSPAPEQKQLIIPEICEPKAEKEYAQYKMSRGAPPSITKVNKVNTVFAGINKYLYPQQAAEASTGDDMTTGAGNLGRQEVYVAQDALDPRIDIDNPNIQMSSSFDDVGDVVPDQEQAGSPPGSPPGGRRRKKFGISRHRRHQ